MPDPHDPGALIDGFLRQRAQSRDGARARLLGQEVSPAVADLSDPQQRTDLADTLERTLEALPADETSQLDRMIRARVEGYAMGLRGLTALDSGARGTP